MTNNPVVGVVYALVVFMVGCVNSGVQNRRPVLLRLEVCEPGLDDLDQVIPRNLGVRAHAAPCGCPHGSGHLPQKPLHAARPVTWKLLTKGVYLLWCELVADQIVAPVKGAATQD